MTTNSEKVRTRRMTIVVPESVYQALKKATVVKNQTIDITSDGLSKISDTTREALVRGLTSWKKLNVEASKRAEQEIKKIKK